MASGRVPMTQRTVIGIQNGFVLSRADRVGQETFGFLAAKTVLQFIAFPRGNANAM
jgi:hypothetical protein